MDRFVAFLWDPTVDVQAAQVRRWSGRRLAASGGWQIVFSEPGWHVLVRAGADGEPRTARMTDGLGIVVGSLFARGQEASGRVRQLSREASEDIIATDGARLIDGHWGNYVALWRAPGSRCVKVLRDPCGATPCFQTSSSGVLILCSHVPDIAHFEGLRFSTDWNAIQAFLLHSFFITRHTALSEVEELLPGQQMSWRPGETPQVAWRWNASTIARSPKMQSFDEARDELRQTAETCFTALGASFGNIAVRMSGGLDSSIVAALARKTTSKAVAGIHLIGRGYERHELSLAKRLAERLGIDLVELEMTPEPFDLTSVLGAPQTPRPTRQILAGALNTLLLEQCSTIGATCIMAGHGGDTLFLQRSISTSAFADYLQLNGLRSGFWRVAYDNAALLEQSIWSVVHDGLMHRFGLRKWDPRAFLEEADASSRPALTRGDGQLPSGYTHHDWIEDARSLPPCKAEQVRGVTALRNYHAVLGHGVTLDAVHPLMSQPIVEFSLRTPSYLFNQGGGDRTLERAAFADLLPADIVRRTHKGFINHRLVEDLSKVGGTLREFLIEGSLVSQGGLERESIDRLFTSAHAIDGEQLDTLLDLLAIEAWLAAWRTEPVNGRGD